MIKRSLARRYAKALLSICQQENNLRNIKEELDSFKKLIESNRELQFAIFRPCYPKNERIGLIKELGNRFAWDDILIKFLYLLIEEDRIGGLPLIIDIFNELADEIQGIIRANIRSTTSLSPDELKSISTTMEKIFNKRVLIEHKTDSSLIGGITAQIGSMVIDGSIKNRLKMMAESLKSIV